MIRNFQLKMGGGETTHGITVLLMNTVLILSVNISKVKKN